MQCIVAHHIDHTTACYLLKHTSYWDLFMPPPGQGSEWNINDFHCWSHSELCWCRCCCCCLSPGCGRGPQQETILLWGQDPFGTTTDPWSLITMFHWHYNICFFGKISWLVFMHSLQSKLMDSLSSKKSLQAFFMLLALSCQNSPFCVDMFNTVLDSIIASQTESRRAFEFLYLNEK